MNILLHTQNKFLVRNPLNGIALVVLRCIACVDPCQATEQTRSSVWLTEEGNLKSPTLVVHLTLIIPAWRNIVIDCRRFLHLIDTERSRKFAQIELNAHLRGLCLDRCEDLAGIK